MALSEEMVKNHSIAKLMERKKLLSGMGEVFRGEKLLLTVLIHKGLFDWHYLFPLFLPHIAIVLTTSSAADSSKADPNKLVVLYVTCPLVQHISPSPQCNFTVGWRWSKSMMSPKGAKLLPATCSYPCASSYAHMAIWTTRFTSWHSWKLTLENYWLTADALHSNP